MTDVYAAWLLDRMFQAQRLDIESEPFPVFDLPAVLEGQR